MINNSTKIQSIIDAILASLQIQTYDNAVSDFNHPQEDYQGSSSVNYSHENHDPERNSNKNNKSSNKVTEKQ